MFIRKAQSCNATERGYCDNEINPHYRSPHDIAMLTNNIRTSEPSLKNYPYRINNAIEHPRQMSHFFGRRLMRY